MKYLINSCSQFNTTFPWRCTCVTVRPFTSPPPPPHPTNALRSSWVPRPPVWEIMLYQRTSDEITGDRQQGFHNALHTYSSDGLRSSDTANKIGLQRYIPPATSDFKNIACLQHSLFIWYIQLH